MSFSSGPLTEGGDELVKLSTTLEEEKKIKLSRQFKKGKKN